MMGSLEVENLPSEVQIQIKVLHCDNSYKMQCSVMRSAVGANNGTNSVFVPHSLLRSRIDTVVRVSVSETAGLWNRRQ